MSLLTQHLEDGVRARLASITEREAEVIHLIAEGLRNQTISERLGISIITVRHHLSSIFSKLDVNDRFELAIMAMREGFVRLPREVVVRQVALHQLPADTLSPLVSAPEPPEPVRIPVKFMVDTSELDDALERTAQVLGRASLLAEQNATKVAA